MFHESIYYFKGAEFKDDPVYIRQTVNSTFGPKNLNFTNEVHFTFTPTTKVDEFQIFRSLVVDDKKKINLTKRDYKLGNLVEVAGTIMSTEIYYNGGELYNVTKSKNWPQMTDKLYEMREEHPNRNRIMRRFSTIVDFSTKWKNRTNNSSSNSTAPMTKQFISNIYLNNNPIPVDTITNQEEWESVDIYTGTFKSGISTTKLSAVVFQSQYFNTTNNRYQTKLTARVHNGLEKHQYDNMDAYEAQFFNKTFRSLYLREEQGSHIPYMFIYSAVNVSLGNYIYAYRGNKDFTGFRLKTPGYLRKFKFWNQTEVYPIKTPTRFYLIGRGRDRHHYATLQKAEYDFEKGRWRMPEKGGHDREGHELRMAHKKVLGIKCAQQEELGDQATCLVYTGDGINYVLLYDPGDLKRTDQGRIVGVKEILIPGNLDRLYQEPLPRFEITNNFIIKSSVNRRREYQVANSGEGGKLMDPIVESYEGFMVWDLTEQSQWPVVRKYFTSHFTDFTLVGDLIWTCSPQDEPSTVFNLSLSTEISNQVLQITDTEYIRDYFDNMFLKANFLNGTVIKVPFNQIFYLPPKNTSVYFYIIIGVLVVFLLLVCVCCKAKNRRKDKIQEIPRRRSTNERKLKQFILQHPEIIESFFDSSRLKDSYKQNQTMTSQTLQDVML